MDLPERLNTSAPSNASNVSNHGAPFWSQYKSSLTTWFVTTLCTAVVCGLIDLVFLVAICTTRKLRTGSGILIGHLTAMEMSMCLVHMPVFLVFVTLNSSTYRDGVRELLRRALGRPCS
ncbi:hypothetical protein RvY_14118-2 [Ramazzottius varieornatus]|uniref:Uncharacterized protein n=1 Tax=Ramazzottius varieornatus TaxID=947166 RepID=A0A1D1VU43_RAMVA|nr:hypothetical protein RvY_14118-2 [Ramazzottius varieornatus]